MPTTLRIPADLPGARPSRAAEQIVPRFGSKDADQQALERLTAGVAHDFNNLLAIILGNAGMLRARAEAHGNDTDATRATAIEAAAQRGGRLVAQLLAFSRKQVLRPEIISAYTVLSALQELLTRAAEDTVQIRLVADEDLWLSRVDPGQLESAVLNLVINARDAMPTGGTVTITCRNERIGRERAADAQVRPGDYVKVEVKDTGTGIPPALRMRVFEPFFTTKPVGQGSGLGLAQVHGFAGQSGGWVELSSVMGQGTIVSLFLPRADSDIAAPEATSNAGTHILVVEPDSKLRNSVIETLRRSGHDVQEAWDDASATRYLHPDKPLDLLLVNAALPNGGSGTALSQRFRRLHSAARVLLLSQARCDDAMPALDRTEVLSGAYRADDVVRLADALLRQGTFSAEREQPHAALRDHASSIAPVSHQPRPDSARWSPPETSPANAALWPRRTVRLAVAPLKAQEATRLNDFSLGLAEELTRALARFHWISCLSPSSVAVLAGEAASSSPPWHELNLDYLVEGSFSHTDTAIRIVVRLIDMREPGEISWTKRFDRALTNVLDMQDEIAADTAAKIAPEVLIQESERAASRPQMNPTSYGLMLQAIPAIYRLDQASYRAAGPLLIQALDLDPRNAAAHSWLAHWYLMLVGQGWARNPRKATHLADTHASRAVALDPTDARGLTVAGHIRAFLNKDAHQAIRQHDRALQLNPNLALAWCYSGLAHSYAGQHREAISRIEHAQSLSPRDPHGFFFDMSMVMPLLMSGDFERAALFGNRAREANPYLSSTYKGLIAALGLLGRREEARGLCKQLAVLEPDFSVAQALSRSPLKRPEDLRRYGDGLRLGGCRDRAWPQSVLTAWRSLSSRR